LEITITLTETEYNALSRVCADPQEWAENAVKERARVAIEDIVSEQVRVMLANPDVQTIPATVEELVASAPDPVVEAPVVEPVVEEVVAELLAEEPVADTPTN
jgi:hypothetical protein